MARLSTSLDSEIGWQNASLLKELQKYHVDENDDEPIRGVRVAYYNSSSSYPSESDHSYLHNEHWKKALTDRPMSLEVGTVTGFDFREGVASVFWDCGTERTYTYDLWNNLTVYSLGPAGNVGIVNKHYMFITFIIVCSCSIYSWIAKTKHLQIL